MITTVIQCDRCQAVIDKNNPGLTFVGNVHTAELQKDDCLEPMRAAGGGLVGNNIDEDTSIDAIVVNSSLTYCNRCTLSILKLEPTATRKEETFP